MRSVSSVACGLIGLQAYRYIRLGVAATPQKGHFADEIASTLHQDTCSVTSGTRVATGIRPLADQPNNSIPRVS